MDVGVFFLCIFISVLFVCIINAIMEHKAKEYIIKLETELLKTKALLELSEKKCKGLENLNITMETEIRKLKKLK